jgi:hypothetical protein
MSSQMMVRMELSRQFSMKFAIIAMGMVKFPSC